MPAADVTLSVPGSAPIPATVFPGLGPDRDGFGAFTGVYAFRVPAGITSATLAVSPGTLQAQTDLCNQTVTVTAAGPAVFNLSLPPASYTPPPGASSQGPLVRWRQRGLTGRSELEKQPAWNASHGPLTGLGEP